MSGIQNIFLSILRSALDSEKLSGPLKLTPAQWSGLYKLSRHQHLAALIFHEINKLENNLPKEISLEWRQFSEYSINKFDAHLMALTRLSQILEDHGIKMMTLKGLGLALLYPIPQLRECADVDIYCFGEYDRVNSILLQGNLIKNIDHESDKHCSFTFAGINIENHRYFCEYVNRANIVIGEEIINLSKNAQSTDSRVPGILFPCPQAGMHHLMMHTLSHMAWSGISMRQIVDCGLYFRRHADEVDREAILKLWRDTGVEEGALSILSICEKLLGIRTEMIPNGWQGNKRDESLIIKGIFGHIKASAQAGTALGKFFCKLRWYLFRRPMHRIAYNEPFPDSFWESFACLKRH